MKKTKKKATKVKKKSVECKKKKVTKKVSKKTTSRSGKSKKVLNKKKVTVKTKKKRITRKKLLMTDIYPILNRVQLKGKTEIFVAESNEADIIENTIKDLELVYTRKDMKRQVEFTVKPNKDRIFNDDEDLLDIEYLEDEIPEMGQIFP
jgi:hypothetical protein